MVRSRNRLIIQIRDLVANDYTKRELNVAEIARRLNLSPNYLSSLFKKETGVNLSEYLNRFRVERAQELRFLRARC